MQIGNVRVFRPIAIPLLLCTTGCPFFFSSLSLLAPLDSPLPDCAVASTITEPGFATIRILCETEHEEVGMWSQDLFPIALSEQGAVLLRNIFSESQPPDQFGLRQIPRAVLLEVGSFQILGEGFPTAMNREGAAVGRRTARQPLFDTFDAVLWRAGETIDLPPLVSGGWSEAVSINDSGIVVGWATEFPALLGLPPGNSSFEPVLWHQTASGWTVRTLSGFPAIRGSNLLCINSADQIIVHGSDRDFSAQSSFVWESGELTDLGSLGGVVTEAAEINDAGQIVGWSETGELKQFPADVTIPSTTPVRRAFLWEDGVMIDLGTLGGQSSAAVAINNRGDVIGWAATGEVTVSERATGTSGREIERAFLYRDGTMQALDDFVPPSSGLGIVSVIDINDSGDILARAGFDEDSFDLLIVILMPPH